MFVGHFAVALAAGGRERRLPMALLIVAAFAGDIVEGIVAGFYVADPSRAWSHSLPATAAAGAVLAVGWYVSGGTLRESAVVALVSMSHTALDFLTATKTLWPGAAPVGLNLYEYPVPEYALELIVLAVGWAIWRSSVPADRRSAPPVWAMLGLLAVAQTIVLAAVLFTGAEVDPAAMSKFVR